MFRVTARGLSTNEALPSFVTSVRVGGVFPSSIHMPTGGSQSLMAQNAPIADHTVEGAPLTSMLRDNVAAEAAKVPRLSATLPSIAERTNSMVLGPVVYLFIGNLRGCMRHGCGNRWLSPLNRGSLNSPHSMAPMCRWSSRPQHQQETPASQQTASLFDHLLTRRMSHSLPHSCRRRPSCLAGARTDAKAREPGIRRALRWSCGAF
jgi:hypothetical protein